MKKTNVAMLSNFSCDDAELEAMASKVQDEGASASRGLLIAALVAFLIASFLAWLFMGCSTVAKYSPSILEAVIMASTNSVVLEGPAVESENGGTQAETTASDEVDFSSLRWEFGGFNGAGGKLKSGATISNLQMSSNGLHFDSVKNVGVVLGASSTSDTKSILVCFFVKDSSGAWRGGKFDWIADNRGNSRDLNHITGSPPYGGWSSSWIPNPCECAFVLVNNGNKARSNALKGVWKR